MAKKSGSSFGTFNEERQFTVNGVKPITTEFSKGSVPYSIYTINRESAWARWRRGYELATASLYTNNFSYRFKYTVPFPEGFLPTGTEYPDILGYFQGFPTRSKEFRVHWAAKKTPGSVRFDRLKSYVALLNKYSFDKPAFDYLDAGQWFDDEAKVESIDAYIGSVTEDAEYWYVKLNGIWTKGNKLPPPLYVDLGSGLEGLKALNGEVLEDRIIAKDGIIIDRDTINPATQKRYGYVQAVLVDTDEETGVLKFKKAGSVEATADRALVSPATRPPAVGRYFITGPRYCCTCQDFTHREYSYMMNLGASNKRAFPRSTVSNVKPGRHEFLTNLGIVDNAMMTDADVNRILQIIAPDEQFTLSDTVTTQNIVDRLSARDNPGVFSEFGSTYLRSTSNPGLSGSSAEGMPGYNDYSSVRIQTDADSVPQIQITSLTDIWSPVLDEMRYCKHIYAMRFQDDVFPPEPSDFPVGIESMAKWEQDLVEATEKEQDKRLRAISTEALSYMDIPPYNCQAQNMQPMLQRLFNIPLTYIKIDGFTMYDKNGTAYNPSLGEKPAT